MSLIKTILRVVAVFAAMFLIFALWYQWRYSMDEAKGFEIHSNSMPKHLLIGMQGSEFKQEVLRNITEYYQNDSVYIKIVDVGELEDVRCDRWNTIAIIHTWEYDMAPKSVRAFVENCNHDHMVLLATSGSGDERLTTVDGMSSASDLSSANRIAHRFIGMIDEKLNP